MKTSHQFGTTIIELTLYMGLLSIFLLILFDLFANILNTQTRSVAVSLVHTNNNFLLTKLTADIYQADSVITPLALGSSATSLTLRSGVADSVYSVIAGRLQLVDGTGSHYLSDSDITISDFLIERLGNSGGKSALSVSFKIISNVVESGNLKQLDFNTTAVIR